MNAMAQPINADLSVRVVVDTTRMDWQASPSGTVRRKRVHFVGPAESGQVTSLVRYEPNATFPCHDHPDGEEILVLEGVFSDEHGDWPAGTYLLNPEGFRHAPFSNPGCLLFVKLRQFAGKDRRHVVLDTREAQWQATPTPGVTRILLYQQAGFSDVMCLERWAAHTEPGLAVYELGAELFVLEGEFSDDQGTYGAGSWLRFPAGFHHQPRSVRGATLYIKEGGLAGLRSATQN